MSPWLEDLAWGAFGAVFPELVRQFELRHDKAPVPVSYYVRSVLFCTASGLVVVALPGDLTPIAAIYAGVSAPVIVSSGARMLVERGRRGHPSGDGPPSDSSGEAVDDATVETTDAKYVRVRNGDFVQWRSWERFWRAL